MVVKRNDGIKIVNIRVFVLFSLLFKHSFQELYLNIKKGGNNQKHFNEIIRELKKKKAQ